MNLHCICTETALHCDAHCSSSFPLFLLFFFHCPCLMTQNSAEQELSHCSICTAGGSGPDVYLKLQCTAAIQIRF